MNLIYSNRASAIIYNFIKQYNTGVYLLPANICYIVPITFVKAGVKFEFVDIDPNTFCIDEQIVFEKLNKNDQKYSGLVFVHTYGAIQIVDSFFDKIKSINQNFKIIDDRCLCMPNFSIELGIADLVLFSTGYGKYANIGYGSFAFYSKKNKFINRNNFYDDKSFKEIEKQVADCFKNNKKYYQLNNTWLNNSFENYFPEGYVELVKEVTFKVFEQKNKLNKIYIENLPESIQLSYDFNFWRFNILVNNKEMILGEIFKNGLFASSHYIPSNRLFDNNKHEVSEKIYFKIINLFNDFYFDETKALLVCKIIKDNL